MIFTTQHVPHLVVQCWKPHASVEYPDYITSMWNPHHVDMTVAWHTHPKKIVAWHTCYKYACSIERFYSGPLERSLMLEWPTYTRTLVWLCFHFHFSVFIFHKNGNLVWLTVSKTVCGKILWNTRPPFRRHQKFSRISKNYFCTNMKTMGCFQSFYRFVSKKKKKNEKRKQRKWKHYHQIDP